MQTELTEKGSRIEVIDVLRGFTLLGIIIVHFTEQYYAGQPPESHLDLTAKNLADQIVSGLIGIFVQGKFFMIFSFLFGLSFYIQSSRNNFSSTFLLRFSWRLIALFLIGFIHHLHYRGDILTIYAILGFGLLIADRLPDRALLIVALIFIVDIPALVVKMYQVVTSTGENPFLHPDKNALQAYYDALTTGQYTDILRANLGEFKGKFDFQFASGRIYITMGLFMLGLYAGRKKFFETWSAQIDFIKRLCKWSLWAIGGAVLFAVGAFGLLNAFGVKITETLGWAIGGLAYDIFNASLATLYVMGLLLLFRKEVWKNRLMNFYAAGRMGLTTYLGQTLAGFIIFFAPGLGLLGQFGATVWLVVGLVYFFLQIIFSQWWLARYQYGPVEWLWRSATYLKLQPIRKEKLMTAPVMQERS